jgi:hypothetical protein
MVPHIKNAFLRELKERDIIPRVQPVRNLWDIQFDKHIRDIQFDKIY